MRILLPLLSILFIGCSSQPSQDKKTDFEHYDAFAWKAMLQYREQDYVSSLQNFEKAFEVIPDESVNDYFHAAAAALHLQKPEKAKDLIIRSIVYTNTSKDYFLSFQEFDLFRELSLFPEIAENYEEHVADFYANLEYPEIFREVDSLVEVDQRFRLNNSDWTVVAKHDSLNIRRLMQITKEYGWQDKGWLVLWHQRGTYGQSNYVWDFFKPYIDQQIEKGNMRKEIWARYEEERSIIDKREQIYGFYWSQFGEYPVVDVENLDKRRAAYGLPPFWYLNKVHGIPLPEGYVKTDSLIPG